MAIDILIFAAIAGFFVWKLRQTLGQKHGEERDRANRFTLAEQLKEQQQQADEQHADDKAALVIDGAAREVKPHAAVVSMPQGSLAGAIAALKAADRSFDEKQFINGARTAFGMIVEAFAKGDKQTLKSLLKPAVYAGFEGEIDRRNSAGEVMTTNILRTLAADISNAKVDGDTALVTVDFTSEQLGATTNASGEVIDGDPKKPEIVAESWVFERRIGAADPTWFLVSTRTR